MPRRRRIARAFGITRRMFRPQSIGHVSKGVNYAVGNSYRGLRAMFRFGKRKADRDLQMTKDGVTLVAHWPRPLAHGFVDPEHKIPRLALISEHTWAEWQRCYTPAGRYRMHTLEADLKLCGELGMVPYLEPKHDPRFRNQAYWDGVMRLARKHGVKQVRGYTLRENADCLPYMRRAGIRATQLRK
jgi:glycerophosphoryl diester phosphodiesterase